MSQQVIQGSSTHGGVVSQPSFTPLSVGGVVAWFSADDGVTLSVGKVAAWANQVSGTTATQGTAANQPVVDTVSGRDWIRFTGDGDTVDGGQRLITTEAALLTPLRLLGSPATATFYVGMSVQPMVTTGTAHTVIGTGDISESANFTSVQLNTLDRRVRVIGAAGGTNMLMHPVDAEDTDAHIIEAMRDGFDNELRVDGVTTLEETEGTVTPHANAFDTFAIGATTRLGAYYNPGNFRVRDFVLVDGVPSASEQHYLREGMKVRAGL